MMADHYLSIKKLVAGSPAALLSHPFVLVSSRITAQKQDYNYRKLFCSLHHMGVGLMERLGFVYELINGGKCWDARVVQPKPRLPHGLSKWNAILSASIISGFFAAACSHPCIYLKEIKDAVLRRYVAGEKHTCRLMIIRVLTPHTGFKFYVGFVHHFRSCTLLCMMDQLKKAFSLKVGKKRRTFRDDGSSVIEDATMEQSSRLEGWQVTASARRGDHAHRGRGE